MTHTLSTSIFSCSNTHVFVYNIEMNIFTNLFNRPKIVKRGMYVVEKGDLAGGFLVAIKEFDTKGAFAFLYIPHPMEAIYIQASDFKEALNSKDIAFHRQIPPDVYAVIYANWKYYANQQGLPYNENKQLNIRRSKC